MLFLILILEKLNENHVLSGHYTIYIIEICKGTVCKALQVTAYQHLVAAANNIKIKVNIDYSYHL